MYSCDYYLNPSDNYITMSTVTGRRLASNSKTGCQATEKNTFAGAALEPPCLTGQMPGETLINNHALFAAE